MKSYQYWFTVIVGGVLLLSVAHYAGAEAQKKGSSWWNSGDSYKWSGSKENMSKPPSQSSSAGSQTQSTQTLLKNKKATGNKIQLLVKLKKQTQLTGLNETAFEKSSCIEAEKACLEFIKGCPPPDDQGNEYAAYGGLSYSFLQDCVAKKVGSDFCKKYTQSGPLICDANAGVMPKKGVAQCSQKTQDILFDLSCNNAADAIESKCQEKAVIHFSDSNGTPPAAWCVNGTPFIYEEFPLYLLTFKVNDGCCISGDANGNCVAAITFGADAGLIKCVPFDSDGDGIDDHEFCMKGYVDNEKQECVPGDITLKKL